MATESFVTKLFNYILSLKKVDSAKDNPNKFATIHNLNMTELEKYIGNMRALLLEIAEKLDIGGVIDEMLSQLYKSKFQFTLNIRQPKNSVVESNQYKKHFTITYVQEYGSDGVTPIGNPYFVIDGWDDTTKLIVQARLVNSNKVAYIPIRFESLPGRIIVETYEELDENIILTVV